MITTETENRTTKTEIELYVINKVKELRKAANLSQEKLSLELKLDSSFVGHAERLQREEKYNLNHINEIAKYFDVPIASLFPPQYLKTVALKSTGKSIQNKEKNMIQNRNSRQNKRISLYKNEIKK